MKPFKEWFVAEWDKATGIRKEVLDEMKDCETWEDAKSWLNDLTTHGCSSGMVSGLIYYVDTEKFYDEHEKEIEDLVEEMRENSGWENRMEAISKMDGAENIYDICSEKNLLSWFAFEDVGYKLLCEIEEMEDEVQNQTA